MTAFVPPASRKPSNVATNASAIRLRAESYISLT
jgi:hypothetical protein